MEVLGGGGVVELAGRRVPVELGGAGGVVPDGAAVDPGVVVDLGEAAIDSGGVTAVEPGVVVLVEPGVVVAPGFARTGAIDET